MKTCFLITDTPHSLPERQRLLAVIDHVRGIEHAVFHYPNTKILEVSYNPDAISPTTLVDAVKRNHFAAKVIEDKERVMS